MLERHLAVNLFGPYGVTQAFLPLLARSGGAIINVASDSALVPVPVIPAYSISKAAAYSMTRLLRALLAPRGVSVHAALPGPIDIDMSRDYDAPKASPESVARGIFDGVERGEEDIFPDPVSRSMAESWIDGAAKGARASARGAGGGPAGRGHDEPQAADHRPRIARALIGSPLDASDATQRQPEDKR